MRILVFQHLPVEHPGVFRELWRADGHEWSVVELDEGGIIPDPGGFDLLVAMGGPMDVWDEDAHPWLKLEKTAIRHWVVALERPFLGICLGHQLLAAALGGTVSAMAQAEVGIGEIALTESGTHDPVLGAIGPRLLALHWHGAEVSRLPDGAVTLATTPLCGCQALRWGRHAYGFQFHIEVTADMIAEWAAIPAYRASLEATLGADGVDRLAADVAAASSDLAAGARGLDDAFMSVIRNVGEPTGLAPHVTDCASRA